MKKLYFVAVVLALMLSGNPVVAAPVECPPPDYPHFVERAFLLGESGTRDMTVVVFPGEIAVIWGNVVHNDIALGNLVWIAGPGIWQFQADAARIGKDNGGQYVAWWAQVLACQYPGVNFTPVQGPSADQSLPQLFLPIVFH